MNVLTVALYSKKKTKSQSSHLQEEHHQALVAVAPLVETLRVHLVEAAPQVHVAAAPLVETLQAHLEEALLDHVAVVRQAEVLQDLEVAVHLAVHQVEAPLVLRKVVLQAVVHLAVLQAAGLLAVHQVEALLVLRKAVLRAEALQVQRKVLLAVALKAVHQKVQKEALQFDYLNPASFRL